MLTELAVGWIVSHQKIYPPRTWKCNFILKKNLCRCNEGRILRWDHPGWKLALNPIINFLAREEKVKGHMEGSAMWRWRQGLSYLASSEGMPEASRTWNCSPICLWRDCGPSNTLGLGLWPPKLWQNIFLCCCFSKPLSCNLLWQPKYTIRVKDRKDVRGHCKSMLSA